MERLGQDFRFAIRSLMRRPGFATVAVLTLALGVGANTAMFSVVSAVLLKPLSYIDPNGLVMVWSQRATSLDGRGDMSLPDLEDAALLPAFESLVGQRAGTVTITLGGEAEVVPTGRVTDGLLRAFRLSPYLGRDITRDDNLPGSPLVVVVGFRFWQDRLGGQDDVIGTSLELSGSSFQIVGIAPPRFSFPENTQIWLARRVPQGCARACHTLYTIGRLTPGVTAEAANAQLQTLAARLSADYPDSNFGKVFRAVRLGDDLVADVRSALWFILGAVSLVLLIACANVANLLLVRSETRRGEIAVRAALGASRSRLAGEVLAESVVLSLAGALIGVLLASLGLVLVRRIPAGILPRIETVTLDAPVLLFTLGVSMIVALFFGMGPALMQARGSLASSLVSTQRSGHSRHARRFRSALLAFEVALSLVLLTGAGLVLKSFDRMYRVELGFETQHVTRFQVMLTGEEYRPIDAIVGFFGRLEERLTAIPGVESVGSVYGAPFGSENISGEVLVEGRPPAEPGQKLFGSMHAATPGYAHTAGIPLVRGRWIEATDGVSSLPVAVVSEEFARRVFPDQDPIGQRLRVTADFGYGSHIWTVVGIAGDVKRGVQQDPLPELYVPLPQFGPGQLHVLLRTQAGAAPPMQQIREIVRQLDPGLPVRSLETVSAAVSREVAPTRFYMLMLAIFAGIAVVLASVGLYGVVAYLVSRRTREIGVRIALGARRQQVIGLVLRQGMQPAALGLVVGLLLTLALGRLASSLLFQVSPRDPTIMAAVTAVLSVVALVAVLLPARRASRIDPIKALRVE